METIGEYIKNLWWERLFYGIDPNSNMLDPCDLYSDYIAARIGESLHEQKDSLSRELSTRFQEEAAPYRGVRAFVPVTKIPTGSIPEQVDRTKYEGLCMISNGVIVPEWVAERIDLPHKPYTPGPVVMELVFHRELCSSSMCRQ